MIRLEGPKLPAASQGAIPPILLGDVHRDVAGIPLQIGWAATLADNCGIEAGDYVLDLAGPDLGALLEAIPPSGVVQIEQEWLGYGGIRTDPPGLWISERGYGETEPAAHAKGATVYFLETRPLYAFAFVPPGCSYPPDAVLQVRVNDNANIPPCTVRLQDDRLIPGVRLVTAEFDAGRAFNAPAPPPGPTRATLAATGTGLRAPEAGSGSGAAVAFGYRASTLRSGRGYLTRGMLSPPAPGLPSARSPVVAPFVPVTVRQTVRLEQSPLGTVTADLRGLLDTVEGRYTGTPLGGFTLPAHIVRFLLEETFGETDPARYHAPTWAATAARQTARGFAWRLAWTGDTFENFREVAQSCGQSDLYLDEEDRWRYEFRDPTAPAVATLTPRELLGDPSLGWSAGRDVVTVLEVEWGSGLTSGAFTLESPLRKRHGENHGALGLPYVADEATARLLARDALTRRDHPRQRATAQAAHGFLGLTLRDRVCVETPLLSLYGARRVPFEIVGVTDRGEQRVLALLEADPLALEVPLSGTLARASSWSVLLSGTLGVASFALEVPLSGTVFFHGTLEVPLSGTLEVLAPVEPSYFPARYFPHGYFPVGYFGPGGLPAVLGWDDAGAVWDAGTWDP